MGEHPKTYDVIVIGAGHAGCEAALATARMGFSSLVLTANLDTVAEMSCNPAIGGLAKGQLVREIDALGGEMARCIDQTGIQFRLLNRRKGPAVRSSRAQADRSRYREYMKRVLEEQENLDLKQGIVDRILVEDARIRGVETQASEHFLSRAVIVTTGTFLRGLMHVGLTQQEGGRAGDVCVKGLSANLESLGVELGRLKTGTPPRLDGRTIEFEGLEPQYGDEDPRPFSFSTPKITQPQVPCFITYTNEETHEIIRSGLDRSPLYTGVIKGIGPRYCPSIEDKVMRFSDKGSHQIFVEPEGLCTHEIYPNGISTSLPFDVQKDLVQSVPGFENAHITRPGYAIEYDFFDPRDLKASLETRFIAGLFFAGQINGTTGYEEAAAQGLIAGLNAARRAGGEDSWSPRRDQAYMGVMIDDLITRGTSEPYRMFTSRAEYRLLLREDNADLRLTEIGYRLGLVDNAYWQRFSEKREAIQQEQQRLHTLWVRPETSAARQLALRHGEVLNNEQRVADLLRRPALTYTGLMQLEGLGPGVEDVKIAEQVEIQARYYGYIERQQEEIERQRRNEHKVLPADFEYHRVKGLSSEVREKLTATCPETIGQAARIPGVTPAAISLLLVHLKKAGLSRKTA